MAQPYVGEIRMFGGNFPPAGWLFCNGASLPISEYETLFQLIGTTYGGDGQENFNIPDLQGRVPVHVGNGIGLAQQGGVETVTLTTQQMPQHNHVVLAANVLGALPDPGGNLPAQSKTANVYLYLEDNPSAQFAQNAVTPDGGSQAHDNMQPYLCVTFIISLYGLFPTPN